MTEEKKSSEKKPPKKEKKPAKLSSQGEAIVQMIERAITVCKKNGSCTKECPFFIYMGGKCSWAEAFIANPYDYEGIGERTLERIRSGMSLIEKVMEKEMEKKDEEEN